jgi:hypothetical protein
MAAALPPRLNVSKSTRVSPSFPTSLKMRFGISVKLALSYTIVTSYVFQQPLDVMEDSCARMQAKQMDEL